MKNFIAVILTCLILVICTVPAFAQGSAKNTTAYPVQLFTPDAAYESTVTLGTKGTGTYTIGSGQSAIYINCYSADGTVTGSVKVYPNSSSTHWVLLGTGTLGPFGVNNTGKGTATSAMGFAMFSTAAAKAVTCEVWGQ